jgi:glutamate/tyrosine decarboxylase-like PLP-dependent enzyme
VMMSGLGEAALRSVAVDPKTQAMDVAALREAMTADVAAGLTPVLVQAAVGTTSTGAVDPVAEIAPVAREHGAWLHVDGAFGLFARIAPESRHLAEGVELADSITVDAHKWLNVPYDCGISFVREPARLAQALNVGAPYLPSPDDPRPNFGFLSPENSRRARALAIWATLRAYGRQGHRSMVERHLRLARHLADRVDATPELERLAEVPLNIVCFRVRPPGTDESDLDELNRRLGEALLHDGRVFAGTTVYDGKVAFRPAIVNWQTTEPDVELLIEVLLELLEAQG